MHLEEMDIQTFIAGTGGRVDIRKQDGKIEQYNRFMWPKYCSAFDPRPSTNQSTSLKSGSLFLVMEAVRTYVQNIPLKELNHF